MLIESLYIGLPKEETFYGKTIHTGIGKRPVSGLLHLKKLGFDGDGVADRRGRNNIVFSDLTLTGPLDRVNYIMWIK
jgi:MOSC domain-containing protein YiiM